MTGQLLLLHINCLGLPRRELFESVQFYSKDGLKMTQLYSEMILKYSLISHTWGETVMHSSVLPRWSSLS